MASGWDSLRSAEQERLTKRPASIRVVRAVGLIGLLALLGLAGEWFADNVNHFPGMWRRYWAIYSVCRRGLPPSDTIGGWFEGIAECHQAAEQAATSK